MSGAPPLFPGEDAPEQQAPLGAGQEVQTVATLPQVIRVVIVNVLVLAELCAAMYQAAQSPDEFTPVFFRVFFLLLVPTLILAAISKRFVVRRKEKQ